jgi:hypothetical protein
MVAHADVSMQVPSTPLTEHEGPVGSGVQHSMVDGPAQ